MNKSLCIPTYRFLIGTLLLLPACTLYAEAEEIHYPTTSRVYHPDERGIIDIKCHRMGNTSPYSNITCDFMQTNISYAINPANLKEETEKDFKKLDKQFVESVTDKELKELTNPKLCKKLKENTVKGKMLQMKAEYPIKYKMMNIYRDISCNAKSKVNIKKLFKEMAVLENKLKSKTCKIWNNNWSEEFTFKRNSNKYYWTSTTEATGECGIINISNLKQDPEWDWSWDYESRRIITNPEGSALGLIKCKDFDERTVKYSGRSKDYPMHCETIKFGY